MRFTSDHSRVAVRLASLTPGAPGAAESAARSLQALLKSQGFEVAVYFYDDNPSDWRHNLMTVSGLPRGFHENEEGDEVDDDDVTASWNLIQAWGARNPGWDVSMAGASTGHYIEPDGQLHKAKNL